MCKPRIFKQPPVLPLKRRSAACYYKGLPWVLSLGPQWYQMLYFASFKEAINYLQELLRQI